LFFFLHGTACTEFSVLSLLDALPILLVALALLVVGMVVIWRRTGPGDR